MKGLWKPPKSLTKGDYVLKSAQIKNVQLFLAFPISSSEITKKDGQYGRISKQSIYTPDIPQILMRSDVKNGWIAVRLLLGSTEFPSSGEDIIITVR